MTGRVGTVTGPIGTVTGPTVTGPIGTVTGPIGTVTGRIGTVTEGIGTVTGRISTVIGRIGTVTGRIGTVTSPIGTVTGPIGTVTGRIGTVTGRIGTPFALNRSLSESVSSPIHVECSSGFLSKESGTGIFSSSHAKFHQFFPLSVSAMLAYSLVNLRNVLPLADDFSRATLCAACENRVTKLHKPILPATISLASLHKTLTCAQH